MLNTQRGFSILEWCTETHLTTPKKCILITHTDRREHNSCSCCQERGCAAVTPPELHRNCAKIRCGTTTAGNSGHDSPFPRIFGWRLYYVLPVSLEFKQKAKDTTWQGYSLVLHCFLRWLLWLRIQLLSVLSWFKSQRNWNNVMKETVFITGNLQNCG